MIQTRSRRFLSLLIAPALAVASTFASSMVALAQFVTECFGMFTPENGLAFAGGDLDGPRRIDGVALARDVQQGVRHEAGVPRYSAPRNV